MKTCVRPYYCSGDAEGKGEEKTRREQRKVYCICEQFGTVEQNTVLINTTEYTIRLKNEWEGKCEVVFQKYQLRKNTKVGREKDGSREDGSMVSFRRKPGRRQ